jgi:hypothetical protein
MEELGRDEIDVILEGNEDAAWFKQFLPTVYDKMNRLLGRAQFSNDTPDYVLEQAGHALSEVFHLVEKFKRGEYPYALVRDFCKEIHGTLVAAAGVIPFLKKRGRTEKMRQWKKLYTTHCRGMELLNVSVT